MTTLAHGQATRRQGVLLSGAAIGTILAGVAGAMLGLGGFLAVVLGDEVVTLDWTSTIVAVLASIGLVAAILVRDRPGIAAIGMALAPIAYVLALGGSFGSWWATYQDAIALSGAAENAFWSAMPALGLFTLSGVVLALGAALATLCWLDKTSEEREIS